jgi:hypothetical protein
MPTIIQGDILLEQQLNAILAKPFKNPEAIDGFRFFWKVQLVKALHSPGSRADTWELIDLSILQ